SVPRSTFGTRVLTASPATSSAHPAELRSAGRPSMAAARRPSRGLSGPVISGNRIILPSETMRRGTMVSEQSRRPHILPEQELAVVKMESSAIAAFLARRALRAIAAISERAYDPGHIRDLADAAFFGHAEAALTLARVTLAAKANDS